MIFSGRLDTQLFIYYLSALELFFSKLLSTSEYQMVAP